MIPKENYTIGKMFIWIYNNKRYDDYDHCEPLRSYITNNVPKEGKVLVIGCGNSLLNEQMLHDGYKSIVGIDYSGSILILSHFV